MKSKKRWITIVAVVAIALVPIAWIIYRGGSTERDLEALRKMGVPTTYVELDALMKKPGENAAQTYERIGKSLNDAKIEGTFDDLQSVEMSRQNAKSPSVRAAYIKLRPLALECRRVAQLQHYAPTSTPDPDSTRTFFNAYIELSKIVSLNACLAVVDASKGDYEEACRNLETCFGIMRQLHSAPTFMAAAMYNLSDAIAFQAYKHCLHYLKEKPEALRRAAKLLEKLPPTLDLRWLIVSDFVEHLDGYRMTIKDSSSPYVDEQPSVLIGNPLGYRFATAQTVSALRDLIEALPQDPEQWQQVKLLLSQHGKKAEGTWPAGALFGNPFQTFELVCKYVPQTIATHRLAVMSTKILLHHAEKGALPRTLPSGIESQDPFTSSPLIYKPSAKGFSIECSGQPAWVFD